MTIVQFAKNHLGNGPLAWIIVIGFCYFMFFSNLWALFGGIYIIYMLLMFGVSGILIDFFFVGGGQQAQQGVESPIGAGTDVLRRRQGILASQRARRPPPMMGG